MRAGYCVLRRSGELCGGQLRAPMIENRFHCRQFFAGLFAEGERRLGVDDESSTPGSRAGKRGDRADSSGKCFVGKLRDRPNITAVEPYRYAAPAQRQRAQADQAFVT